MKDNFDVIILGVGGMGSSTLYNLAKKGVNVCGIEQFGIAHNKGSSHGETRIIRKAIFENPDYIPLINKSYEMWGDLEKESGLELNVKSGLLLIGNKNLEQIKHVRKIFNKHRLEHKILNKSELSDKFPQFNVYDDDVSIYDPNGGFLYVEKCVEQYINNAKKHGAKLYFNEKVESWKANEGGVSVRTNKRNITGDKLIITAGSWAKKELDNLNVNLKVLRKVLLWYDSPIINNYTIDKFPTFLTLRGHRGFYGFPVTNELGMKIAEHTRGDIIDNPYKLNNNLMPDDEKDIKTFMKNVFPKMDPKLVKHDICMYTMSKDGNFIMDIHPENKNVVIGAGFSGHGYKFAPVIGEILGDLALKGSTEYNIDFLKLNRLLKNK